MKYVKKWRVWIDEFDIGPGNRWPFVYLDAYILNFDEYSEKYEIHNHKLLLAIIKCSFINFETKNCVHKCLLHRTMRLFVHVESKGNAEIFYNWELLKKEILIGHSKSAGTRNFMKI